MKNRILEIILFFCLIADMITLPCAASDSYNWYCRHAKDHLQPSADQCPDFVEKYDAKYIDKHNADPQAAEKVIYLTFDAGYENGNVAKILDILKEEEVPAAFFILGNLVERNTDLVIRMAEEGHTVCNHTSRHKDMSQQNDEAFLAELHALEKLYSEKTGKTLSAYYRPPEGRFSIQNLKCAQQNHYKTVFWSFAYPDWNNQKQMSAERAKEIILENAHNGEVMLLHPTSQTNAEILKDVIIALKADGYHFGTLDELFENG